MFSVLRSNDTFKNGILVVLVVVVVVNDVMSMFSFLGSGDALAVVVDVTVDNIIVEANVIGRIIVVDVLAVTEVDVVKKTVLGDNLLRPTFSTSLECARVVELF